LIEAKRPTHCCVGLFGLNLIVSEKMLRGLQFGQSQECRGPYRGTGIGRGGRQSFFRLRRADFTQGARRADHQGIVGILQTGPQ